MVATPLNPNFGSINGVPGMGFDYEHLLAVSPPAQGRIGQGRGHFRAGLNEALPLYYSLGGVPLYSQPQPTVIVLEQPAPAVVVQPSAPEERVPEVGVQPTGAAPAAPLPELGQFILVRRDGRVVLAVAFTINGNRLTYITHAGSRLSFPLAELDAEATRQMNEVNGTMLALPN